MKKILALFLVIFFIIVTANFSYAEKNYRLEKVLILSRHNLRAPLIQKNSELSQITPHNWFHWRVDEGDLSLKGGLLETAMGQYFRLYFADEKFFHKNYIPKKNETNFYANSLQRTIATTKFFSAGLFPLANIEIEYKPGMNETGSIFVASDTKKFSKNYFIRLQNEKEKSGGEKIWKKNLSEYIKTIEKILDFQNSHYAKKNNLKNFSADDFKIENNPYVEGNFHLATRAGDALLMQYYEEKNIFGEKITENDLKSIADANSFEVDLMFDWKTWSTAHINPMLNLMRDELSEKNRKFTFLCGHDVTLAMVLSALGVEKYTLPESIEKRIPLGAKLVIEKRIGDDGKHYAKINLVYQSTKQIENVEVLDLNNPPKIFPLKFKNLQEQENNLYLYSDFEKILNKAIDEYGVLVEK